jgi:hypothetical protein
MIGLGILYLILCVVSICLWNECDNSRKYKRFCSPLVCCIVLFGIFAFASIIVTCITASNTYTSKVTIRAYNGNLSVLQERKKNLLPEILGELNAYPKYEKEIFVKYIENAKGTILSIPPELKSDQVIVQAATEIATINDDIYKTQLGKNNAEAELKQAREATKWIGIFCF